MRLLARNSKNGEERVIPISTRLLAVFGDGESRARWGCASHDLRHEAGSRFVEAGWPLYYVQAMLGHSNRKQISIYLNVPLGGLEQAMRKYDQQRAACSPLQVPRSASIGRIATPLPILTVTPISTGLNLARPAGLEPARRCSPRGSIRKKRQHARQPVAGMIMPVANRLRPSGPAADGCRRSSSNGRRSSRVPRG